MEISLTLLFFTAFIVALSGALVPGPLLTITISETLKRGIIAGPLVIVGHGLLEVVLLIGLLLGLSQIVQIPLFGKAISIVGGFILLWMGRGLIKEFRQKISLNLSSNPQIALSDKKNIVSPIIFGVTASIANPYFVIWWATIGIGFLHQAMYHHGVVGVGVFFAGHILADLGWYTLISVLIVTGKKFLNDTVYRCILLICGLFLIILAGVFIANGIMS